MSGLTERERAILEEEEQWRRAREIARPAVGASGIGMTKLIERGMTAWSRTRGWAGVDELGEQLEPRGGIVIDITERGDDDGEMHRTLVCYDPDRDPHQRITLLDEAEVNRDSIGFRDVAANRRAIRRLATQVAKDRRTIDFDREGRVHAMHIFRGFVA